MDNNNALPKGMYDFDGDDIEIRTRIIGCCTKYFKSYGGKQIDTPVLEYMSTITSLYGEEFKKLVYELNDIDIDETVDNQQKKMILRYDLTVPGARYIASNRMTNCRKFQIGKVYRRDNPKLHQGRLREFIQADFDIIGDTNSDFYDFDILCLLNDILTNLLNDTFKIFINNKQLLFHVLTKCGVEQDLLLTVCSTVDKLDKLAMIDIMNELIQKKLSDDVILKITKFISFTVNHFNKSNEEKLTLLLEKGYIDQLNFDKMNNTIKLISSIATLDKNIIFNPCLSRGMDYYTGIIFEATYDNKNIMPSSISAGGRYDNMISKLTSKPFEQICAVGVSIGVERIATILKNTLDATFIKNKPFVFVASVGKNIDQQRIILTNKIRSCGIPTDTLYTEGPSMRQQLNNNVLVNNIPYMIIIGQNELDKGMIKIKNISNNKEDEYSETNGILFLERAYYK